MKSRIPIPTVIFAVATSSLPLAVPAGPAFAAIEEIVVTARKREESAQDIPVVIQAFNAEDLARYGATSLTEIAELATQVVVNPGSSGNGGSIIIRGVGAPTLDPGIEGSVTINVDGVQIDRGHIVRQGFFDLEGIEILKGPQALFFGKNSPGGVVAVRGALPSFDENEVTLSTGYEFESNEIFGEVVLSGAVTDTLAVRLAYRGSDHDGFLKNQAQPIAVPDAIGSRGPVGAEPFDFPGRDRSRIGGETSHAARLTVLWEPNDRFRSTLRVLGSDLETDNFATLEVTSCSGDRPSTANILTGERLEDPFGDCKLNGKVSHGGNPPEVAANWPGAGNGQPRGDIEQWFVSLENELELDTVTLTSVTGFYYYDYFRFDNFDGTVFWQLGGMQLEDHKSFSEELRILTSFAGPVNFMGGVYFETFERDSDNRGKIAPLGVDPTTGFSNNWEGRSTVESDTWSVFGQVTWNITERLELSGGARYTNDDREAVQGNVFTHPVFDGTVLRSASLPPLESKFDDDDVSPEVTLTWRPTDALTLFGAYRTGYKSGGFSTNTVLTPIATADSVVFDAEDAEGFEFGVKSMWLDGRLLFNGTVYYYEFDDLQVSAFDPATTSFNIINAASSTTTGVEVESRYLVNDWLNLRGQISYNEGDFDDFPGAPCWAGQTAEEGCVGGVQDLSDHRRPNAPEWNGSIGFDVTRGVPGTDLLFGLSSDLIYQDDYSTQTADNPFSTEGDQWRWNLRASLATQDNRWEAAVIGRNLTNERYVSGTADKPGGIRGDVFGQAIRPRQVMLQFTYRMGGA